MKKTKFRSFILNFSVILFLGSILSACLGEDPFEKQRQADSDAIRTYVARKNLQGVFTNSGLYYDTITMDTFKRVDRLALRITASSVVEISYKLYDLSSPKEILLTSSTSYTFQPQTGAFFSGLAEGILLTRKGQNAIFILPSLLAMGSQARTIGNVTVPGNSSLRLEVKVLDVRDATSQEAHETRLIKAYINNKKWLIAKDSAGVTFIRTTENPTGDKIAVGDNIKMGYIGNLLDDRKFDSNANFNVTLDVNGFIRGFVVGLTMMKTGEKGYIFMTSSQAYGAKGSAGSIAPYSPLFFEITSLEKQ